MGLVALLLLSGCQGNNSDTVVKDIPSKPDNNDTNTILPPIDINATTDVKTLSVVNGNRITVTGGKITKDIYIMGFNSSGSTNTEGKVTFQYPAEFINGTHYYGIIDPGTATITDGRVHFVYTSPDDITEVNGTTAKFLFYDTKNADVNVSLYIDFNLTGDYVSTTPILKTLVLSDDNLTIYSDSQREALNLQAYTDQSTTDVTTELDIKYPSNIITNKIDVGNLPSKLSVMNGKVMFDYSGPSNIDKTIADLNAKGISNPIKINIYDKATGANTVLNLNFLKNATAVKYKNYELYAYPDKNVSIRSGGQKQLMEVYLKDKSTTLPVEGEVVIVQFFNAEQGKMDTFNGVTNADGHIVFNYTAPKDITSASDMNVTFKLKGDLNDIAKILVHFDKTLPSKDYTGYTLTILPKDFNISLPEEEKIIDVYLSDSMKRPASNEVVYIDYFSGTEGTMNKYEAKTDSNGHVAFTYKAPKILIDNSKFSFTVKLNGTNITDGNVTVGVQKDTSGLLSKLIILPSSIKVLKAGATTRMQILTLDENNVGVPSVLTIEQPNADGINYGSFSTLQVTTNADGIADINYTAPANIDTLAENNITKSVVIRDVKTLKEANLTISYEKSLNLNKDVYDIGLAQNSDVAIDDSGDFVVSIFKKGLPTNLIDSENVLDVNISATAYTSMVYFNENDQNISSISYSKKAQQGFALFAKKTAGVVVLNIVAKVGDANHVTLIKKSFPVVINSGEMSTMSMFLAKSELDTNLNIYKDYYTIHAVDKYGNPVKSGTVIHPTLINGIKVVSTDSNGTGELSADNNALFTDNTKNFSEIKESDRMIVLPSEDVTDKSFLGNWDINSVDSNHILTLFDKLDKNSSANLRYVIGNETRTVTSNGTTSLAVANIQAIDGKYETDNAGNLQFIVSYDPALKGEKIYLAANGQTSSGKVGIAREAILHNTGKHLILENNSFTLDRSGESIVINANLYDEGYNLITGSPKLAVNDFNTSWGSYSIDNWNGRVLYTAPEKKTDFEKLRGQTTTFRITLEETPYVYAEVTLSAKNKTVYTNYTMHIIPNDFVVDEKIKTKTFKVYLLDENNDTVINERLVADFFDAKYGEMQNYTSIASSYYAPYATFTFKAPDDVTNLSGSFFDFNISLENDSSKSANVRVHYIKRANDVNYTDYNLTSLEDNITISSPNQSKVIDLYLETGDKKPAANEVISLEFFNGKIGSVNSFSAITDANGHVAFDYTSPNILPDSNTTLVFSMDRDVNKTVSIGLNFDTTVVPDPKYTTYKTLKAYPDTNVTITKAGQSAVIEGYLEDNKGLPVSGENVIVKFFDVSKGTLNSFSAITDANGHVAFNYTAPADITTVADMNITMKLAGDVNNTDSVPVYFDTTAPIKDYSNYTLSLVDANRTITKSLQVEIFNVYLEDNSTGVAKAAAGETITLDFFNGNIGTVNSFSAVTDANGHAQFTYTAPEDLTDLNGTAITFRIQNTTADVNKVTSTFTVSSDASLLSKLRVDSSITLSRDAESKSITILAFNGNGEPFDGGFVTVRYPSEITDGNVSGGRFIQSSVAIVNGQATFDFVGPDPLSSDVEPLNFIFTSNNATSDINTTLTVNYVPDVPKIVVDEGNIIVTKNGEVVSIGLSIYDKYNSAYEGGNIKIIYPDANGSDIGSFNASSSAVVDGKATFIYTASNPLDLNGTTIPFKFYHDSDPARSQVDFNITIDADANQLVLTNYVLDAIYETNMDLNTSKSMTFYVKDEEGNKIDDSNITSITATVLNSALGFLEDTEGHTGNSLTVNNENNVQMNIKTKTLSGLIPIRVDAKFKDANNNDQNLTKVINIVVLSGPPTAMSLSYAGTSQDSEYAKFVENWVLTVTDKYNNLVNTTPAISMGAILGYAKSSANTSNVADYLYYRATANDGNLTDSNPDTFKSAYDAFDNVDITNDKLVLFGGNGYRFNAFGKWDISNVNSSSELELSDDYNGTNISGLGYAVGHNFRNETCAGSPVVANVYAKDGNNTLGQNGSMIIQVEYDYYLVGKSIVLWANLVGENNNIALKIGLGQKVTLRGNGLTGDQYSFAKGDTGVHRLYVNISDTVEYYKNANFGYAVEISGDGNTYDIVGTSMDQNITSCVDRDNDDTGGVGYVDVNITNSDNSGVLKLTNVLPSKEF